MSKVIYCKPDPDNIWGAQIDLTDQTLTQSTIIMLNDNSFNKNAQAAGQAYIRLPTAIVDGQQITVLCTAGQCQYIVMDTLSPTSSPQFSVHGRISSSIATGLQSSLYGLQCQLMGAGSIWYINTINDPNSWPQT